jgi:hypothetical protein
VAVERYKKWDISCHAGTAPRNAPSRIYGLQIKKDFQHCMGPEVHYSIHINLLLVSVLSQDLTTSYSISNILLILSPIYPSGFQAVSFLRCFPTKTLYAFLFSQCAPQLENLCNFLMSSSFSVRLHGMSNCC